MTNAEKFTTAEERAIAFDVYCRKICTNEDGYCNHAECAFSWLDREAEEDKPLPCPFCGCQCTPTVDDVEEWRVYCKMPRCYRSSAFASKDAAIAAHNRVASAVAGKKEGK